MPLLNRHGIHIHYTTHGSPSGRPLLLTHGFSSTSAMWQSQIPYLSQHFRLIIWDMRGHGKSDYPSSPSEYSEEHTVHDMAALIDHVCGRETQVLVGGLSLGGYMSLAFYRRFPARVAGLVVMDTGPGFRSDKAREGWNATAEKTAQEFERDGLKVLEGQSKERKLVVHRNAEGLVLAARGMLTQRDGKVMESLGDIKVPTLVVVGENDEPFLKASEYMARKIPGARKVVVPRAGHAVNIDNPEGFEEAVRPFLEQFGSPRAKASL